MSRLPRWSGLSQVRFFLPPAEPTTAPPRRNALGTARSTSDQADFALTPLAETRPSLLTADFADSADVFLIRVIGVIRG